MTQLAKKLYTVEEYFALEAVSEQRNEYLNEEIIPMADATFNHQRILSNVLNFFYNASETGDFEAFMTDIKVQVKAKKDYTYPDILVVKGDIIPYANRDDTLTNPCLIAEVLSKPTQSYDKSTKFERYKSILALEDYLLIDQKAVKVVYHRKITDGSWQEMTFTDLSALITLNSIGLQLPLAKIYQRIKF
jgi:Uma2 family endonuclease